MKKSIAFLICLTMILSLFSCNVRNGDIGSSDTKNAAENDTSDTVHTDNDHTNDGNGASNDAEFGQTVASTDHYKIVNVGLGEIEYHIYDQWGKEVLVEITNRPLHISIIDEALIEIRIGMGTGTSVSKYYDVRNERFSQEYLGVVAASGNLLAYVDAPQGNDAVKGTLVVRDIFNENEFFKTFWLDFSPREVMPITFAEFTEREMALVLVYLNQNSQAEESVTLPIRTSTFDQTAFTEADRAIMAYEQVLNGSKQVYDVIYYESFFYLWDVQTPYSLIPLPDEEHLRYAYTDMDKDGVCEFAIDCGDTLILRYYEGTVYLYPIIFRYLYYLQTDGTHSWNHNGSDFEYGEKQLYFDGIEIKERHLWRIVNDGEPDAVYYIGNQRVTKEEILRYIEDKPNARVTFTPLKLSMEDSISPEDALKIADEYWGNVDGREEGACGSQYVGRVAILKEPAPVFPYYRVAWNVEHYFNGNVEGYEDGRPHCVETYEEILVNIYTGECIPYSAPELDGKE